MQMLRYIFLNKTLLNAKPTRANRISNINVFMYLKKFGVFGL